MSTNSVLCAGRLFVIINALFLKESRRQGSPHSMVCAMCHRYSAPAAQRQQLTQQFDPDTQLPGQTDFCAHHPREPQRLPPATAPPRGCCRTKRARPLVLTIPLRLREPLPSASFAPPPAAFATQSKREQGCFKMLFVLLFLEML